MRPLLLLALLLIPAPVGAQTMDGPVAGGAFGMSGADYFGDLHDRPPFARPADPARTKRQRVTAAKHGPVRTSGRRGPL